MKSVFDKLLSSSQDPTKVSLTLRGILVSLIPVIIVLSAEAGYGDFFTETKLMELIDQIVAFVTAALTTIGIAMTLLGLLRRSATPDQDQEWMP